MRHCMVPKTANTILTGLTTKMNTEQLLTLKIILQRENLLYLEWILKLLRQFLMNRNINLLKINMVLKTSTWNNSLLELLQSKVQVKLVQYVVWHTQKNNKFSSFHVPIIFMLIVYYLGLRKIINVRFVDLILIKAKKALKSEKVQNLETLIYLWNETNI